MALLHASFSDYLTDPARSKGFYIDRGESVDDITRSLFKLYLDKPWDTMWAQYTPKFLVPTGSNFYLQLKTDAEISLYYAVTGELRSRRGRGRGLLQSQQVRSECLDALSQINPIEALKLRGLEKKTIVFLLYIDKVCRVLRVYIFDY